MLRKMAFVFIVVLLMVTGCSLFSVKVEIALVNAERAVAVVSSPGWNIQEVRLFKLETGEAVPIEDPMPLFDGTTLILFPGKLALGGYLIQGKFIQLGGRTQWMEKSFILHGDPPIVGMNELVFAR